LRNAPSVIASPLGVAIPVLWGKWDCFAITRLPAGLPAGRHGNDTLGRFVSHFTRVQY